MVSLLGRGMMHRHDLGDGTKTPRDVMVVPHERREATCGRHSAHQDCVVDGVTCSVNDLLDAQVDIGAEAPVEFDLSSAKLFAPFRGALIDECELDVLLALVHQFIDEDERRDVSLDDLDPCTSRIEQVTRDLLHVQTTSLARRATV